MQRINQRRAPFADPRPVLRALSDPGVSLLWLVLRLYVGWQWLTAGWGKLYGSSSTGWVSSGEVDGKAVGVGDRVLQFWQRAVEPPQPGAMPRVGYGWYRDFLQYLIDHRLHTWFAYLIAYGEFLVGVTLILGAFTAVTALIGATMNFNYMMAGSASINPVLFAGAVLLILAWKTAGYIGLDRWLLPLVGTPWQPGRLFHRTGATRARPLPVPVPARRRAPTQSQPVAFQRRYRQRAL
jgi:thiosulfate dehydrogenase [quinone] large subunit